MAQSRIIHEDENCLIAQAPREPDIAVKYARALTGSGALGKAEELLEAVLATRSRGL